MPRTKRHHSLEDRDRAQQLLAEAARWVRAGGQWTEQARRRLEDAVLFERGRPKRRSAR